ncbi:MAG: PQQ-dependent sugar dehydrogenase [bacterium]|nr:PQQ-dependent sugar dehydrogenase [bacterium]
MKLEFVLSIMITCLLLVSPVTRSATLLTAVEIVTGLSDPVLLISPPNDSARLFIVEQGGRIRIFEDDSLLTLPFLNISSLTALGSERGLLGLAFEPDYETSGRFYVNYTDNSGNTVVSRYAVSGDPDLADASSAEIIIEINQPFSNHNGGMIAFGPLDGQLYIGMGDGGSGGDPQNNAQTPTTLLGKMLRLDVSGSGPGYAVPADNPFVGSLDTLAEIWTLGLRNPWRFSFDRATGDLYIADVGQGDLEEVDFQDADSDGGENYGWRLKEGLSCYNPSTNCDPMGLLDDPIHQYSHGGSPFRCSISGGYVYRGCAIADLSGTYFFGDYCSGQVWSLRYDGVNLTEFQDRTTELGLPSISISSFGEDAQGELYIIDYVQGRVFKIVPDGVPSTCSSCCDQPGDFSNDGAVDITDLTATVDYMFNGGAGPSCPNEADINASCEIDISDLTYRVEYMFSSGPSPLCGCVS